MIFYATSITNELIAKLKFNNQMELSKFLLANKEYKGSWIVTLEKENEVRTPSQNSALHLFYEHLAQTLNNGGFTVKKVLEQKVMDLDWNKKLVKEILWRPAQEAILAKESTTELNKKDEIDMVYDHLNRHLGEKFGVYVPFPKRDENEDKSTIKNIHENLEVPEGKPLF